MSNTATEIFAFLLSISGWIFIAATLPMEYWKVSSNDGSVITTGTYFSNLWKDCVTDTTGASNCKDFTSMLALDGYLHVCRALLVSSVIVSFFGAIFALFGMKCTKIGGSDKTKSKIAFFAGFIFLVSGLCSMTGYSVYAHQVMSEFFDPLFFDIKFELGVALFIGWSGSIASIVGGIVFCYSLMDSICTSQEEYSYTGKTPLPTSYTKSNYKHNHFRKATQKYSSTSLQFGKNAYV